jgi:hypothetical protein
MRLPAAGFAAERDAAAGFAGLREAAARGAGALRDGAAFLVARGDVLFAMLRRCAAAAADATLLHYAGTPLRRALPTSSATLDFAQSVLPRGVRSPIAFKCAAISASEASGRSYSRVRTMPTTAASL